MTSAWDSTPAASAASSAPGMRSAWDATPAASPAPAARGVLDNLGDMGSAFAHHVLQPFHGAAQFVENAVAAGANKLPDNPVSRAISQTAQADNAATAKWESDYQASTPNGWGANTGAIAGTVAPFLVGAVPRSLGALGDMAASKLAPTAAGAAPPLVAKMVSGAAQGATMGAAQPVTDPNADYWQQKGSDIGTGAAFGTALPTLGGAAGGAARSAKTAAAGSALLNPSGYAAKNIALQLGADAPAIAGDLSSAPTFVPGSQPTSAQAGAHPSLVMMEKALSNSSPDFKAALAARENANNAARLATVGRVAQTPDALQAAIAQRDAVTGPMRDFAVTNGNPVPVGGVQGALSSLENGSLGVRPTIGGAASGMRSAVDDMTTVTPPNTLTNTPGSATAHPAMLDALRQNANDYLSKYAPQGFVGTQEQAAMVPVKGSIIDAIDAANPGHKLSAGGWGQGLPQMGPQAPGYRDYLSEFANRSVPINTMEAGQQVQAKLLAGALNSSGDASTALPGYRAALAQALRNAEYGIDPAAQAQLEGVQSDLQRATISHSIKSGGSDTAYNQGAGDTFLRALGAGNDNDFGKMATAGGATLAVTGSPQTAAAAAFGAKKAGGLVAGRVQNALGDFLLDPQKLGAALQAQGQPAAAAAPAVAGRLSGKMSPALAAAIALQLQQPQAPQVVAPADRNAYAQ